MLILYFHFHILDAAKRKQEEVSFESPAKKLKSDESDVPQEQFPKKIVDGCIHVKGGDNLTVITLHEALNHQRYDQFEVMFIYTLAYIVEYNVTNSHF